MQRVQAFAVRLADVLATLESAALLGAAERRVRGLGAQLQFACRALPCEEALVAIELEQLGRLRVPGVATADSWRAVDVDMLPSGTPFAYLFGGGSGYAAELEEGDAMLAALAGVIESKPRYGMFVPIRLGGTVVGGAALLREAETLGDRELGMAERLADVLSGTLEAFRTERVLFELLAAALPDLCDADKAPDTGFARGLEKYLHGLRLEPSYRKKLELAGAVARLAEHGPAEADLAAEVLAGVERYLGRLAGGAAAEEPAAASFE
jgi:hypothetical protein